MQEVGLIKISKIRKGQGYKMLKVPTLDGGILERYGPNTNYYVKTKVT